MNRMRKEYKVYDYHVELDFQDGQRLQRFCAEADMKYSSVFRSSLRKFYFFNNIFSPSLSTLFYNNNRFCNAVMQAHAIWVPEYL
jgi:hypothetical protein